MPKVRIVPAKAAKPFASLEELAARVNEQLENGSDDEVRGALDSVARHHGMSAAARVIGLSRPGIYSTFGPGGNPTLRTVRRLLRSVGLRLSVTVISRELE